MIGRPHWWRCHDAGIVLIEMLVVGFGVVLLVFPILLTIARLTEATGRASDEARTAAEWVARHGSEPPADGSSVLTITVDGDVVVVTATKSVELVGVGGLSVERE
ncbi:MAG: hypothetical protein KDB69_02770, partial [Acidimicrobiia bacterium]|nr:hypothetical protein [Acidimicrobiia bacterium]